MGDRQQSGGGDTSWAIRLQAAGGVDVFLEDLGASAFLIKSSGAVKINNGAWRHLAFTWKISTQTLKIYIDNVDVTTASSGSGTIANITSGDDMLIGEYVGLSGDFTGVIDEVGIWAEELSVNKISDLYNGGDGLFIDTANNWPTDGGSIGTNIGAIWHFNETAMNQAPGGTDVEDTSGNGNHGTASASMTDADFVTGKVAPGGADVEASILKSEDGLNASEKGIITVGGDDGRLVLKGGDVADTGIRFNLDSTEAAKFDAATKTLIVDNGITTSQQIIARAADSASENIFEAQDSSFNILMNIEPDGEIAIPQDSKAIKLGVDGDATFLFDGNSLNIVANAVTNDDTMEFTAFSYTFRTLANTDIPMNFAGTSNPGLFTWMEDEDYFAFSDDILMNTSEKQYFRDTAIGIYSQADTFMDLFADGGVRIGDSSAGAPTNYVEIESDGDVNYVAGAGQQFGEIYYHGAGFDTALAAQDTFYQILGFDTNGESNGSVTPDHTNDHITVGKAGRYLVTCSIAARSAASNKYDFHVKYNNGASDCANLTTHRHTTTANRVGSMSISGIFDFPASATVELWVQRSDGGAVSKTITIESVTLSVVQIGGTT
jgi:hypothetical protein